MSDFQQNTITNRQAVLDYIDANSGGGGGSQDLASVLNAGNISGTNDIIFDLGQGLFFNNGSLFREGTTDAGLSGLKGVAQICSVGYELKWEAGRLYVMEQGGTQIRQSLYNFNNTPGSNDDDTKGYVVGSIWSLDNGNYYTCTDNTTGAAVWTQVTTQLDYTEYISYVIQAGTSSPSIVVGKNDTGFTFVIDRTNTGEYLITATGAFPDYEKVVPAFNCQAGSPMFHNVYYNDADSLIVNIWRSDGALDDTLFTGNLTVRIYN